MKNKLLIGLACASLLGAASSALLMGNKSFIEVKADSVVTVSSNLSASSETKRYWFINNQDGFWDSKAKFGIHVISGGGVAESYYLFDSYTHFKGQSFFYVDVPLNAVSFKLCRFASSTTVGSSQTIWGDETGEILFASLTTASVHWCSGVSYPYVGTVSEDSPFDNPHPSAELIGKILEGFVSCSSNANNGYGAASKIYSNVISPYLWQIAQVDGASYGDWRTETITDYNRDEYKNNGAGDSYTGLTKKDSFTVYEKWCQIAKNAGIDPDTGASLSSASTVSSMTKTEETNGFYIVGISSVIAIIGAASIFVISKKRREE